MASGFFHTGEFSTDGLSGDRVAHDEPDGLLTTMPGFVPPQGRLL